MNLCQIYSPNPRQLIRIINKFSLLKENLDNRKKLFLFILIYSEMRLIETYKEINFIEHFYELHLNFHQIRFRQYALNRAEAEVKLLSFVTILIIMFTLLMEIHLYLIYFYYIEHIKSSRNDYKECKNAYYPTNKCLKI